jgi:hypothetical protein
LTAQTLTDVGVGNTKISKETKTYILLKMAMNKIVQNKSNVLQINYLDDESAMTAIEAMKNNDAASILDLQHGQMTNLSGAKLCELLAFNSSITRLNLGNNPEIDDEMHELIQSKVLRNRSAHDSIKQRHDAAEAKAKAEAEEGDAQEHEKGGKEGKRKGSKKR